jgi:hypothetical protein
VNANNFDVELENTIFESNRAHSHGGALYYYSNNNQADFVNCSWTRNVALQNGMVLFVLMD